MLLLEENDEKEEFFTLKMINKERYIVIETMHIVDLLYGHGHLHILLCCRYIWCAVEYS